MMISRRPSPRRLSCARITWILSLARTTSTTSLRGTLKGDTIFARSPPGRPPAYGQKYDDLILKCVKEQRAKQQCAPASFIRKVMLKKNWLEVPTEQWIVGRKQALGIIRVQIKLKPKLNERLYAARLEVAKW